MTAYAIYHHVRSDSPEPSKAGPVLAQRIAELWRAHSLRIGNFWVVRTDITSDQIRDQLAALLSAGDTLIILKVGCDAAWYGFDPAGASWLIEHVH